MRESSFRAEDRSELLRKIKSLDLSSLSVEEICLLSLDDLKASRKPLVRTVSEAKIKEAVKSSISGPDALKIVSPSEMESFLVEVLDDRLNSNPPMSEVVQFAVSRFPEVMSKASLYLRNILQSQTDIVLQGKKVLLCSKSGQKEPIFEVTVGSAGYLFKEKSIKSNIDLLSGEKHLLKDRLAELIKNDSLVGLFSLIDQTFEIRGVSKGSSEVTKSLLLKGDSILIDADEVGVSDKVRHILTSALGAKSNVKKVVTLKDYQEGIKYQLASPSFSSGDIAFENQKAKIAALAVAAALLAADNARAATHSDVSEALVSSAAEAASLGSVRAPSVFADIVDSDLNDLKSSLGLILSEESVGVLSEGEKANIRIHLEQLTNRKGDLERTNQETPIVKIKDIAGNIAKVSEKILSQISKSSDLAKNIRYAKLKSEDVLESLSNRRVFGDYRK